MGDDWDETLKLFDAECDFCGHTLMSHYLVTAFSCDVFILNKYLCECTYLLDDFE